MFARSCVLRAAALGMSSHRRPVTAAQHLNVSHNALTSEEQLEDDEDGVTGAEGAKGAVSAREDVGHGLAEGDHDA